MSDILLIISTGTLLFIFTSGFITFFLYSYRQRINTHLKEKEEIKNVYQKEILKAQLEMQEQTFLTISQEIHDNIGQILSLIRLNISTIKPDDFVSTEHKIKNSKELLDQVIEDLRSFSKRFNTDFIDRYNLHELLKLQLTHIQNSGKFQTNLELHGKEINLDAGIKLIIYRIFQEALNNIIKHSKAVRVSVVLVYLPDKIILSLKDDGIGFDQGNLSPGIGIHNLHYRAKLIGAQLSLQTRPGGGTLVQLILPYTN